MTVSAQIAATIGRHARHVFGVMGNGNAYFVDAIIRQGLADYIPLRHEAGAVVAADAYYRAGGGLAVATATYGAGFTNLLTPLAEAVMARTPMLVVVGDQPVAGPRPWDVDQAALARAVGAPVMTVGKDVERVVMAAVQLALDDSTPVVLQIPYDLAEKQIPAPIKEIPLRRRGRMPMGEGTGGLVEALAKAERPLVLGGRGAWLAGAGRALDDLATILGAPTATTALARGLFGDERFDLGLTGGFGPAAAMEAIGQADVVAVFGASLNQFTTRFGGLFGPEATVFQIDVLPGATSPRVDHFLQADAGLAAAEVVEGLRQLGVRSSRWRDSLDIPALREPIEGEGLAEDGRLDPRSAACEIGRLLPPDRVVVSDGGHFIGWANMYWPVASPERMVMVGTAFQSIGMGFASVPGAVLAKPESVVVLTTGDGGGLMALADLESAVRVAGGRGLAVVWNDAAYGAEVNVYGRKGLRREAMDIPQINFAALAESVGAEGVVVRTLADLEALARWAALPVSERRFLLLDLRVSVGVVAPYQEEIYRLR